MKIDVKKGYQCPNDGENIIVLLENGIKTGAKFQVAWYCNKLCETYHQNNFSPIGLKGNYAFDSPVVAWYTNDN